MDALPKLDRAEYRRQMRVEMDRVLEQVADAVDDAPRGRVIRDSEEKARDALDHFRTIAYQKAMQLKIDAAEAAFPPSGQRSDEAAQTEQRPAALHPVDGERPLAVDPHAVALSEGRE